MKSLKQVFGIAVVTLALYGGYTLVLPKKPVDNTVSEEFREELAKEGIFINEGKSENGRSGLFDNLVGAPQVSGSASDSHSSTAVPSRLLEPLPQKSAAVPQYAGNAALEEAPPFNAASQIEAPPFQGSLPDPNAEPPAWNEAPAFESNPAATPDSFGTNTAPLGESSDASLPLQPLTDGTALPDSETFAPAPTGEEPVSAYPSFAEGQVASHSFQQSGPSNPTDHFPNHSPDGLSHNHEGSRIQPLPPVGNTANPLSLVSGTVPINQQNRNAGTTTTLSNASVSPLQPDYHAASHAGTDLDAPNGNFPASEHSNAFGEPLAQPTAAPIDPFTVSPGQGSRAPMVSPSQPIVPNPQNDPLNEAPGFATSNTKTTLTTQSPQNPPLGQPQSILEPGTTDSFSQHAPTQPVILQNPVSEPETTHVQPLISSVPVNAAADTPTNAAANPLVNAEARPEFLDRLSRIREVLNQGDYRLGHQAITELYQNDLNAAERELILPVIDKCGWAAFFSKSYFPSEPAYRVKATDTLESIAAEHRITPELIAKINGIQNPDQLTVGRELKIPRGPLDARISLSRREVQILANGLFACRFRTGIGHLEEIQEGRYRIGSKFMNPRYVGENGEIESGAPDNPLGSRWIELDGVLGLHGTNDPKLIGTDQSPVEGFCLENRDVNDLYDMLTPDSEITIER